MSNELIHLRAILDSASSAIVGVKGGRFFCAGSILDAHYCYSLPFRHAESRFLIPLYHVRASQTPQEVLEIASQFGSRFDHPYITDVLSVYRPRLIAKVSSDDLLDTASRLHHVDYGFTIVSTESPCEGIANIGLPVAAKIVRKDWINVYLPSLVRVLATLPSGRKVDVGILEQDDARVLRIACGDNPSIVYYLPARGQGFSRFILAAQNRD